MRGRNVWMVSRHGVRAAGAALLWCLLVGAVVAETPAFLPVGDPQRLPEPGLERLHVDRQGLVWLATQYGLYRWDGHDVHAHLHDPADPDALPAAELVDLAEDANGDLWLASRNAGLIRFDPATGRSQTLGREAGLASEHLLRVVTGPQGRIWFSDRAGGLSRIDPDAPEEIHRMPLEAPQHAGALPQAALAAGPGGVWVGAPGGLHYLPAGEDEPQWLPLLAPQGPASAVVGISVSDDGAVALATEDRIWVRDAQAHFQPRASARSGDGILRDIRHGPDGRIWVAAETGLLRLDRHGRSPTRFQHDPADPQSFPAAGTRSLASGPGKLLWVVTPGEGLVRVIQSRPGLERIGSDPELEPPLDVLTVTRQAGRIWLGSVSRGMVAIGESGAPEAIHPLEAERDEQEAILAASPSGENALWIADEALRLWRMEVPGGDRRRFHRPLEALDRDRAVIIADLYEDDSGRLWLATLGDGLHRYDPETDSVTAWRASGAENHGLNTDYPQRLHADDAGRLWIGSDDRGLFRYRDGAFHSVADGEGGLAGQSVEAMTQGPEGRLWVGLFPGGLAVLDPEDPGATPRRYTTDDGLPGNEIAGLEVDAAGRIWVSTSGGLALHDPDGGFLTFGYAHGLTGPILNAGAHARDPRGRPVFGGNDGGLRLDSTALTPATDSPKAAISRIRVDGEPVALERTQGKPPWEARELRLDHDQVQVELNLFLPDYRDTRVHEYRYRLGSDGDWIHLEDRNPVATLTHPEPGRHEFQYQARGPDGLWSPAGNALSLSVAPPPWRTPWAHALYVLLSATLLALAALAWRRRTRREALLAQERAQRQWVEQLHGLVMEMAEPADRETLLRRFLRGLREILPVAAVRVELDGLERLPPLQLADGVPGPEGAEQELALATRRRRLGRMQVWPPEGGEFRPRDLAALRAIADQAATALESGLLMAEADSANRAKSAFLAKISHEIRTPLSGMLGLAGLMLDRRDEGLRRSDLLTLRNSGRGLMAILDDILDNARLEAGRMELRTTEFDLVAAVEESLELFVPRAREQGLVLAGRIDAHLPRRVVGDEVRFRQILGNLVSNAVKFTEQGSVCVEITAGPRDWLELAVTDTGPGLTEDARRRLFHPYARDDQRPEEGTGLGLVICRDLVALMRGELRVASQPGQGSCFSAALNLPWRGGERVRPRHAPAIRLLGDPGPVRALLLRRLRDWGLEVLEPEQTASGGPEIGLIPDAAVTPRPGQVAIRPTGEGGSDAPAWPLREADLAACLDHAISGEQARSPREAHPGPAPGGRVLVAEDNPINARVVTDVLAGAGYRVTIAGDGHQALDRVAREAFDVVLMDRHMPGMDGLEATRRLRARASGPALPIIGLTAAASAEEQEQCLAAGMDQVVIKDGDPGPLLAALTRVLSAQDP